MTPNLPAKSNSKGLQRRHLRRYANGKITLVNPEIKKTLSLKTPNAIPSRNYARSREGISFNKLNAQSPVRKSFPPKIRWYNTLKPITGPTKMDLIAKKNKELEPILKTLRPGEHLAIKFKLIYPKNFSVGGGFEFTDEKGEHHKLFMEYRMSNSSLIRYLQEMNEEKKPLIIKTDDFGTLEGVREAKPTTLQDTIPTYEEGFSTITYNNNKIQRTEGFGGTGKTIEFNNQKEMEEYEEKMWRKGKDIFGNRISPQTKIEEYKQ